MKFSNATYYGPDFAFHKGGFSVENGRFTQVGDVSDGIDIEGAYVIPGLVDIHNHGNSGCDFSDGDLEGLTTMARYLAANGITSFAPASITLGEAQLARAYEAAAQLHEFTPEDAAALRGIHMEGPFFSFKKKGAQNPAYLRQPDAEMFLRLNERAKGLIRIADVAPELPGAMEYIELVRKICTVSVAHTDANYDEAKAAFDAGASHLTHLYNAMPALHHREPGVIGAAAENGNVTAELICDGKHVHPSAVRAAFGMFGAERICMISDALSACGMEDGDYELGGQKITVRDGLAFLEDGVTIAGSAANLFSGLLNTISFGIRPEDAIRAATWNPAKVIGALEEIGSLEAGKCADFLILNGDFTLREVWLRGKKLEQ